MQWEIYSVVLKIARNCLLLFTHYAAGGTDFVVGGRDTAIGWLHGRDTIPSNTSLFVLSSVIEKCMYINIIRYVENVSYFCTFQSQSIVIGLTFCVLLHSRKAALSILHPSYFKRCVPESVPCLVLSQLWVLTSAHCRFWNHLYVFQHTLALTYMPGELDALADISWCLANWNHFKICYLYYLATVGWSSRCRAKPVHTRFSRSSARL